MSDGIQINQLRTDIAKLEKLQKRMSNEDAKRADRTIAYLEARIRELKGNGRAGRW